MTLKPQSDLSPIEKRQVARFMAIPIGDSMIVRSSRENSDPAQIHQDFEEGFFSVDVSQEVRAAVLEQLITLKDHLDDRIAIAERAFQYGTVRDSYMFEGIDLNQDELHRVAVLRELILTRLPILVRTGQTELPSTFANRVNDTSKELVALLNDPATTEPVQLAFERVLNLLYDCIDSLIAVCLDTRQTE